MDRKVKRHQIAEQFIFMWRPEKNTARTLLAFAIFSGVIHFLGFYLFQVVYPETDLPELRPDRITLLNPERDDVRAFMEKISDRVVYLHPPSENSISRIKLSDHAIRFVPSFAEARPELRDSGTPSSENKYPVGDLPFWNEKANWKTEVIFSPILQKRGIAPNTALDEYLSQIPNLPKIRVNLTVGPDGTPFDVYISDRSIGKETKTTIAEAVQALLRFKPDDSRGDDPGWIILGSDSGFDR
ncbi:MAG: hypothetical protein P1V20_14540 [Verrucomicrobiales bacterium]|nr:hypothetical protein [Verrucomicrobiales bacterium]